MLIAGLTGGLACGKTFVAAALAELGCHIVEADELGREVMRRGGDAFEPVIAAFGLDILRADGEIDRSVLAKRVFADAAALRKLNTIVHPAVRARSEEVLNELAARDPRGIAIYVAAILVETGFAREFAKLILVNCGRQQQIERSIARGLSEADTLARLERQLPDDRKLPWADFVIDTSGPKEETLRQSKMVYDRLRELSL